MKKLTVFALSALALAACGKSGAADPAPASSSMASTSSMHAGSTTPAAKTGDSTGVVKKIDASAGTITLDHQAIPGVGWPAMTMTFKATPPTLLNGIKAGDHVRFSVRVEGDSYDVRAIAKQR